MHEANEDQADLRRENIKSLQHRYPSEFGDMNGAEVTEEWGLEPLPDYPLETYRQDARYFQDQSISLIDKITQVVKAIHCYEYQTSEYEGWKTSKSRDFCDSLRVCWLLKLPGYDAAAFGSPFRELR